MDRHLLEEQEISEVQELAILTAVLQNSAKGVCENGHGNLAVFFKNKHKLLQHAFPNRVGVHTLQDQHTQRFVEQRRRWGMLLGQQVHQIKHANQHLRFAHRVERTHTVLYKVEYRLLQALFGHPAGEELP